jgi:hypothetical protein
MVRTTGMRFINPCHWRNHHWPNMLATKTPVEKMNTATMATPRPGTPRRYSALTWMPGIKVSAACKTAKNTASNKPTNHMSTQTVMAKGSHTSKPVMKYCLKLRCFMGYAIGGFKSKCVQWPAQEVAQPPELEVDDGLVTAAGAATSVLLVGDGPDTASAGVSAVPDAAPAPPPLKSVAYQPVPLS